MFHERRQREGPSELAADRPCSQAAGASLFWQLVIFGLAASLRVAHVLAMRSSPAFAHPSMDALYHLEWARAFSLGEDFQPGPFFRAPLYVWFLGLTQKVFGPSLLIPRLIQSLFGASAAVLSYRLARRAFGEFAAVLAGLMVATYWVLIYFDGELLIPTLIVPLDLAALLASLRLARDSGLKSVRSGALGAGLLWGLSAIARPNVLLLQPVMALWLMAERGFRGSPEKRFGRWLAPWMLYTLGVLLPIAPITLYNLSHGDQVLISSQAGVNFWIGNNPASDGSTAIVPGTRGGWWEGYYDAIAQAEQAVGRELPPSGVSAYYAGLAWDWIRDHPGAALRLSLWKLRLFWTDWELGNNQAIRFFAWRFSPVARFSPLGFPALVGLAAAGLYFLLSDAQRRRRLFPLWSFLLLYTLSVVAFFVCSRYRVPVLPILAILAGGALARGWQLLRSRRFGRLSFALFCVLAIAFGSSRRPAAIKTSPANGYLQLGNLAEAAGELRAAEGHYRYAAQLDPGNPFAQVGLARVLLRRGQLVEAEGALAAVLALDPWRADALDLQLTLFAQAGREQELEELARRWSERSPHLASPHYHLALLRLREGRRTEAFDELHATLERDPRHQEACLALAQLEEELGRPAEAIRWLERVLALASTAGPGFEGPLLDRLIRLYEGLGPAAQPAGRLAELRRRRQALRADRPSDS